MEEKILKWEEEVARITEAQAEANRKYNERIRALREKIKAAKEAVRENEDRLMAEAVRDAFGDIGAGGIAKLREKLARLAKEEAAGDGE